MTARLWWWGGAFVCAAPTACAGGLTLAPETLPATAGVPVLIAFDPPLLREGRLLVRHEAGPASVIETACTGVRLSLPPGPAFLRLEAGGRVHERTLVVEPRQVEVLWTLAPR